MRCGASGPATNATAVPDNLPKPPRPAPKSVPNPWVRPGWHVALCLTAGHQQPLGWQSTLQRDQWVRSHQLTFPDHELFLAHGEDT